MGGALGGRLILDIGRWAAVVNAETVTDLGEAEDAGRIPPTLRRRLPQFTRDVVRCALPLMRATPGQPIILSSRYGDLSGAVTLLSDIVRREPVSPSLFGLSVHNAPIGALSLCVDGPGDQTAVAGAGATLDAGLTEAYARLACSEAAEVVLIHADDKLPSAYAALDDGAPGVFVAMTLRRADASDAEAAHIEPASRSAGALVDALARGVRRLSFSPPSLSARAA